MSAAPAEGGRKGSTVRTLSLKAVVFLAVVVRKILFRRFPSSNRREYRRWALLVLLLSAAAHTVSVASLRLLNSSRLAVHTYMTTKLARIDSSIYLSVRRVCATRSCSSRSTMIGNSRVKKMTSRDNLLQELLAGATEEITTVRIYFMYELSHPTCTAVFLLGSCSVFRRK